MDKRYYQRVKIDALCEVILKEKEPGKRELTAKVVNMSESGLKLIIEDDEDIAKARGAKVGDIFYFQGYDEFELYRVMQTVIFQGEATVVRISDDEDGEGLVLGCIHNGLTPELEKYIIDKKTAAYFEWQCGNVTKADYID